MGTLMHTQKHIHMYQHTHMHKFIHLALTQLRMSQNLNKTVTILPRRVTFIDTCQAGPKPKHIMFQFHMGTLVHIRKKKPIHIYHYLFIYL